MNKKDWVEKLLDYKEITPNDGQYFFGYYDLKAMNDKIHLVHKVDFIDRLPIKGDIAKIGYVPINGGDFVELDTTESWCFQQGSMLQFLPNSDEIIAYNVYKNGILYAGFKNIETNETFDKERPISTIAPNSKFYLSVNMIRLYDFRPGYGYACYKDKYYDINTPEDDGVWYVDTKTGQSKLLISLKTLSDIYGDYFPENSKLCINHITVSPDSKKYVMLVRNMNTKPWKTLVLIANTDGNGEIKRIVKGAYASHYWWYDKSNIIFHSNDYDGDWAYIYDIDNDTVKKLHENFFSFDGHMRVSKNKKFMTYDRYPNDRIRRLFIYDMIKEEGWLIGKFNSPDLESGKDAITDIRSDLHPRISPDDKFLTIDTLHENRRSVFRIDLDNLF